MWSGNWNNTYLLDWDSDNNNVSTCNKTALFNTRWTYYNGTVAAPSFATRKASFDTCTMRAAKTDHDALVYVRLLRR